MTGKFEFFGRCVDRCESPIERDFLVALVFTDRHTFEPLDAMPTIARDGTGLVLGQQVPCKEFRIDFALTRPGSKTRLAIELDGFEYHGKTAEQFDRHTSRERVLVAAGWTPLRYTGRRIRRSAAQCVDDVMMHAAAMVDGAPMPAKSVAKATRRPIADPELARLQLLLEEAEAENAPWERLTYLVGLMQERTKVLLEGRTG